MYSARARASSTACSLPSTGSRTSGLSVPGLDLDGWCKHWEHYGVQGVTTDDDPIYGLALLAAVLDW